MVLTMMPRVSDIISLLTSKGSPDSLWASQPASRRSTTSTMTGTRAATRRWANAGCMRRRWRRQLSPSLTTSPLPNRKRVRSKTSPFQ